MPLYKFIEKEHLKGFFESGCLRLGTVYDFNDTVKHGIYRGDPNDGAQNLIQKFAEDTTFTKDDLPPHTSTMFQINGSGTLTFNAGAGLGFSRHSENGFIFCTSHLYSERLFMEWNRREKLDACYEILNRNGFFTEISKTIINSAIFFENANVTYTEEEIDYPSNISMIHPAFTKVKKDYDWQYENRAAWGARGPYGSLNPWIIHVPEARKYCRPFAFLKKGKVIYENA